MPRYSWIENEKESKHKIMLLGSIKRGEWRQRSKQIQNQGSKIEIGLLSLAFLVTGASGGIKHGRIKGGRVP